MSQVPRILIVPPVAAMMVKNPVSDEYKLDFVEDIIVGSAPLSAEMEEQLLRRYRNVKKVRQGK